MQHAKERSLKGSLEQHTDNLADLVHDIDAGKINELAVVAEGEEKTTWFVWILVLCSTISGLLFGASLSCRSLNTALTSIIRL